MHSSLKVYTIKTIIFLVLVSGALYMIFIASKKPSNDRNWSEDQAVLPYAEISGDVATIKNIRNFSYASTTSYTKDYYDKTVDISKVKKAYFIVEPFSGFAGAAHTFLSFEFPDNTFISISVEIRKEKGEAFSALKGLFRNYEIMYVIADERDVVKLRSNYRKDDVYVYPVRASTDKVAQLFRDMLVRANKLHDHPEFYNTITNNCTTNIVDHVNDIVPNRIPWSRNIVFPAHSDAYAYDLGLIDTDLSFEDARKAFHINERALLFADDQDFSLKIRTRE